MGGVIGIILGIVLGALLIVRVDEIDFALPIGQLMIFAAATILVGHRRGDLPGEARRQAERARSVAVRVANLYLRETP